MVTNVNSYTRYCRYCAGSVLSVVLLLGAPGAAIWAATPVAYGENFVRLGHGWQDGWAPPSMPAEAATKGVQSTNEQGWRGQLEVAELTGGPYADALAEPLSALALSHRHEGDLPAALALYGRALHVVRINDGLYSERQIPIVREILATYRQAGDYEQLDKRYDYFFRLYGRGQPPFTDLRMRADLEYLRWQREALRLGLPGEGNKRLLELYNLNKEILQSISKHGGGEYHWYRELVISQLRNLYLVQVRATPKLQTVGLLHSAPPFPSGSMGVNELDMDKQRLENIQRAALPEGVSLLQDLIARSTAEAGPLAVAGATLELADWYQWNGHRGAGEHYRTVIDTLQDAGEEQLLKDWMGRPVELPDNGAFWQARVQRGDEQRGVVEAVFDVTAGGRVRNLRVAAHTAEDEGGARRLKRELARLPFRPKFFAGQPVEATQLRVQYQLTR